MTTFPEAQMALLEPLMKEPRRSAILMDVDGTLAPIVDRPEDAVVPEATTQILAELADRFRLVACVTGRRALDARRMVGVDELIYIGNQGFELLRPEDREPQLDAAAAPRGDRARKFLAGLDAEKLGRLGLRQEDKGPIQVLHWRGAPDEAEAEAMAGTIASRAEHAGVIPLSGRKVLELRPVAGIDKGSAVHTLLVDHAPLAAAIFAGDDRTDLDAFRAMARLAGSPRLGAAVRLGVFTDESPPEIETEADLVVSGTDGVLDVLTVLAQG